MLTPWWWSWATPPDSAPLSGFDHQPAMIQKIKPNLKKAGIFFRHLIWQSRWRRDKDSFPNDLKWSNLCAMISSDAAIIWYHFWFGFVVHLPILTLFVCTFLCYQNLWNFELISLRFVRELWSLGCAFLSRPPPLSRPPHFNCYVVK